VRKGSLAILWGLMPLPSPSFLVGVLSGWRQ
jgi:hypothetical protein